MAYFWSSLWALGSWQAGPLGGITEELLTRFFLLSGVAWLLGLAWSNAAGQPATGAVWAAIVIAAVAFAMLHLPATTLVAPLTPLLLVRGLLLNGLGGLVFGIAYWQVGLEAAMLAHFTANLVLLAGRYVG